MVREANLKDAAEICSVLHDSIINLCSSDHGNDPGKIERWLENKTVENCQRWLNSSSSKTFVATISMNVAGVIMVGRDGYIYLCYIRSNCKGCGLGAQMLGVAEDWLRSIGCSSFKADSTATARGFYKKFGYIACGEPDLQDGMFSYPLKKQVTL